jgi:hypothetical protein
LPGKRNAAYVPFSSATGIGSYTQRATGVSTQDPGLYQNGGATIYRTRLTHTMEVAQMPAQYARALRLNEDLAEAVAWAMIWAILLSAMPEKKH